MVSGIRFFGLYVACVGDAFLGVHRYMCDKRFLVQFIG